jgi:hypothetical protein
METKRKRCPNGSRKNKKTGKCDPIPTRAVTSKIRSPTKTPNYHANIIQRFMKKTKHARISNFLTNVCSESGVCIAFGKEIQKIKDFFGGFDLMYVKDPIQRIGSVSSNGFVNEIKFTHKGYDSYAVLKSASTMKADNLMYEYRVGQFLNKMSLLYPCFIETYSLFKYNNDGWNYSKKNRVIDASIFKTFLTPQPYDLIAACKSSKYIAILVQHLKNAITIRDLINIGNVSLNYEFLTLLYQVYFVLDQMKDIFTHYDLHAENVLLYEPSPTKYIQYHYHSDTIITFKSIYVAKIIDYGRCYFKDGNSSQPFQTDVCMVKECNTKKSGKCGTSVGFGWLYPPVHFHVNSSARNKSHDLLLVHRVLKRITIKPVLLPEIGAVIQDMTINLIYRGGTEYGTPEKINCPNKICTVSDMRKRLEFYMNLVDLDGMFNQFYYNRTKLGDMHVYSDGRPLQFIES